MGVDPSTEKTLEVDMEETEEERKDKKTIHPQVRAECYSPGGPERKGNRQSPLGNGPL